jgi:4-alpha-glucanotransferase
MSIGAPPDVLNTAGQNWGLVGFNPNALEAQGFTAFCHMLDASMRYSGAIRLDHVLGLKRLYIIPEGSSPVQGAYLRFPFEALLAVTILLSVRQRCIVIGEDLGTVPDHFRETLADWGLWSYQLMMFERLVDGTFAPPESYRHNSLVTFTTHDLPTFAGWRSQQDFATKEVLGLDPGETRDQRCEAVEALRRALEQRGLANAGFHSVARYLADTPSRLLVVAMEDVLGLTEQVNLPGTIDEHPNWRRKLPIPLEDLPNHPAIIDLAAMLATAGRGRSRR